MGDYSTVMIDGLRSYVPQDEADFQIEALESQLAASQERVAELSSENAGLRFDLASVCLWLCDWDGGIESLNAVALAKHVKEVCKERGHRLTEQRARTETAERRVAELEQEQDARRESLAQELRGVLAARGLWCPELTSDLIPAFASAIDTLTTRAEIAERERDEARQGAPVVCASCGKHEWPGQVARCEPCTEALVRNVRASSERERDEAVARADEAERIRCRHGWRGSVPREGESIANHCPSCGGRSLFIGSGGWLTCANLSCPDPSMRTYLGKATRPDPDRSEAESDTPREGVE